MNPTNAPFFVDNEVIKLTQNGVWLSDEIEIDHEQTVRMFAKNLKKDAEGYFLQIGRETKRILVEDTAYFVTRIEGTLATGLGVCLNDDTREQLDPATLRYRPGRLTCRIHHGQEEAKFLHAAYFELLRDLNEDDRSYYLNFGDTRIELALK
jgi:hypothetical protein